MLRSFHSAAYAALYNRAAAGTEKGTTKPALLEPWARFWYCWVSAVFLKEYLRVADRAPFLPETREELSVLLDAYLLEKAINELGYALVAGPDRAHIPLKAILDLLEAKA